MSNSGRGHLRQIPLGAGKESGQVQQPDEKQVVVL